MDYPLFAPPIDLAAKPPKDWSKSEAIQYFDWFMESMNSRVEGVLAFIELNVEEEPAKVLLEAQDKLARWIVADQFSSTSAEGRKLTNQGYAFAADLGLLVARYLVERGQGKVIWSILKRPKSDRSFNLPVLTGFGVVNLDPIAGSIGDAAWIARGNKKPGAWLSVLDYWSARIVKSG